MRIQPSGFRAGAFRFSGVAALIVLCLAAGIAVARMPADDTPARVSRTGHTATLMDDGRVLIVGGEHDGRAIERAEVLDPASGENRDGTAAAFARADHTATLLRDGRVLVAGGRNGTTPLDSVEAWDGQSGKFSFVGRLTVPRSGHAAARLSDGRVLFAGGEADGTMELFDGSRFETMNARLSEPRFGAAATLLLDGRVLLAGGRDANGTSLASADLIDLTTGRVASIAMKAARVAPMLNLLPDGKVQVIGGDDASTMEIFAGNHFTALTVLRVLDPKAIAGSKARFAFSSADATKVDAAMSNAPSGTVTRRNGRAVATDKVRAVGVTPLEPWVTTDKADYSPGQVVTVTGGGFAPGETVTLLFERNPETTPATTLTAVADANGEFTNADYVCIVSDLNVTFTLTATGQTSGLVAVTSFTDAGTFGGSQTSTPTYGSGTTVTYNVTVSITNVGAAPTSCTNGDAYTFSMSLPSHPSITFNSQVSAVMAGCPPAPVANGFGSITLNINQGSSTPVGSSFNLNMSGPGGSGGYAHAIAMNKANPVSVTITSGDPTTYNGSPQGVTGNVIGVNGEVLTAGHTILYNGSATQPTNANSYAISASYVGDANYNAATVAASNGPFDINKADYTSATITSANPVIYNCNPQGVTIRIDGVGGETNLGGAQTIYYNGSTTQPTNVGSYPVTLTWAGTSNYNGFVTQPVTGSPFAINRATPSVTPSYASGTGTYIYDGTPRAITAVASGCSGNLVGTGNGTIAYWYQGTQSDGTVVALSNTPPTNAGAYTAYATYTDVVGNYNNANSATVNININRATPQAKLTPNLTIYDFYETGINRHVRIDGGGLVQVTGVGGALLVNPVADGNTYHYEATDMTCPAGAANQAWSLSGYDDAGYYVVGVDYAGTNNYLPLDNVDSCVTEACTPPGNNYVYQIDVTNEGSGYTATPGVTINGLGAGATATATVVNQKVKYITITAPGSGYTAGATVSFSGGGGGIGAAATVRVATPQGLTGAAIVVTNGGSGYGAAPAVTLTGGGCSVAPTATATIGAGAVTSVTINTPGSGCTSTPLVTFSGGGGSGALASVRFPASPKAGIFRINGAPHEIIGPFTTNAPYDGITQLGVPDITVAARHVYAAPHVNAGDKTPRTLSWQTYNSDNPLITPSWYCSIVSTTPFDANGDSTATIRIDHATPDAGSLCRVRAFYTADCDFNGTAQFTQDIFINPALAIVEWATPNATDDSTPLTQTVGTLGAPNSNAPHLDAVVYWVNNQTGTPVNTQIDNVSYPLNPYCLTCNNNQYTYYPPAGSTLVEGQNQVLSLEFTTNNPDFISPRAYNQFIDVDAATGPPPPPLAYCDTYHSPVMPSRTIAVGTTLGSAVVTSAGLFKDTDQGAFITATGINGAAAILSVTDASTVTISTLATATSAPTVPAIISPVTPTPLALPGRNFTVVTTTGSPTVTSNGLFSVADVGLSVTGTGIPTGAYITAFTNASTVTISGNATKTGATYATFTRTFSVTTASGNPTVTSAGRFLATDVGRSISGFGIPVGATITTFTSANQVSISPNPTATGARTVLINDGPMRGMVSGNFGADVNGRPDLLVAHATSLAYYQGNGDGTFTQPPVQVRRQGDGVFPATVNLHSLVNGNFDGGANSFDTALTDTANNAVYVFLYPSTTPAVLTTGTTPYGITAADLTGDGRPELVVTNWGSNSVQIFTNNGAGSFSLLAAAGLNTSTYTLNAGDRPWGVVTGNFIGGPAVDVMVALNGTTNSVAILEGDGTGRFVSLSKVIRNVNGPYPRTLAAGDLDNDGDTDVIVGNYGNPATTPTGSIFKMLNTGGGNFSTSLLASVVRPSSIVIGDLASDGDLIPDVAAVSASANTLYLYKGASAGANNYTVTPFGNNTKGVKSTAATPHSIVFDDFDLTTPGKLEIATSNASEIRIFGADIIPAATINSTVVIGGVADNAAPYNTGGQNAVITVNLTGTGPYVVKWSDGLTQSTTASTVSRTVNPAAPTAYTITSVNGGSACGGTGGATITIEP